MAGVDSEDKKHVVASLGLVLLIFLLVLTIFVVWIFRIKRFRYLHETGASMFFGIIAGVIVRLVPGDSLEDIVLFNTEIFFDLLLPPIIFNAGYGLQHNHFFRNFGPILTFALIGTIIATFITGGITYLFVLAGLGGDMTLVHCMLFGALISAIDPVTVLSIFNELKADVDLYALVFGESVLNDAVAIVLFTSIARFETDPGALTGLSVLSAIGMFFGTFFGSLAIGVVLAFVTCLIMKVSSLSLYPLLEVTLFILMSYCSFVVAEAVKLSGIVSILFCGIFQARYTYYNMSTKSKRSSKEFFEVLNFMAENFIFSYMGINLFAYKNHDWKPALIALSFLTILIARACNVYPLSYLINKIRKPNQRIPMNYQHMMWFSGLRGAIAFALAVKSKSEPMRIVLSMTLVIAIVTVVLFGGGTLPMLEKLNIKIGVEDDNDDDDNDDLEFEQQNNRPRQLEIREPNDLEGTDSDSHLIDGGQPHPVEISRFTRWFTYIDRRWIVPFLIKNGNRSSRRDEQNFSGSPPETSRSHHSHETSLLELYPQDHNIDICESSDEEIHMDDVDTGVNEKQVTG